MKSVPPFTCFLQSLLALAFCWLSSTPITIAQPVLSGIVMDDSSGQVLSFVRLSLRNTQISTVTNSEGLYRLRLPQHTLDTLYVRALGYASQAFLVEATEDMKLDIRLKAKPLELSPVTIIGATPQELIRKAAERIPENYPEEPSLWEAFYRQQNLWDFRYAEVEETEIFREPVSCLQEGIFEVYLPTSRNEEAQFKAIQGMAESHQPNTFEEGLPPELVDANVNESYKHFVTGAFFMHEPNPTQSAEGTIHDLLSSDNLRSSDKWKFLDKEAWTQKRYTYHFLGAQSFRGREAYVVELKQIPSVKRRSSILDKRIYLDTASLAIMAVHSILSEGAEAYYPSVSMFGIDKSLISGESWVEYAPYNGKWYPSYISLSVAMRTFVNGKFFFGRSHIDQIEELKAELLLLHPLEGGVHPFPSEEQFLKDENLDEEVGPNPVFWEGEAAKTCRQLLQEIRSRP